MVGKLFKHEIKYYIRSLMFVEIILFAVALMTRIIQFLENDSIIYDIVFGSSVIMLVIITLAAIFLTVVMGVVRFYKNLFTHEGYLSFTLPVSPMQHLFVKLSTYMLFMVVTVLSILVALSIATFGDVLVELVKAGAFLFEYVGDRIGHLSLTMYAVEFILLLLVSVAQQMIIYYFCMSVGQLTGKNRIWLSLGVYFIIYIATQVFETILIVIYSILDSANALDGIIDYIGNHIEGCAHFGLWFMIVFYALVSGVYFLVSHRIISRKLNLE